MSLALVGLPMSGKTTVGRWLAKRLGVPFFDTDEMLCSAYQKSRGVSLSAREIFLREGETFFRALEKEQIAFFIEKQERVIATGGGSLLDAGNRKILQSSQVIYLQAPAAVLWERTKQVGIPAYLQKDRQEEEFYIMTAGREPFYESLATITVQIKDRSIEEIIEEIIRGIDDGE